MKQLRIPITVAVVVVLLLGAVYIASARGNKDPGVLPPDSRVQGLTYEEWSAKWWQYVFSIPASQNPLAEGTGDDCVYQQVGNVGLVAFDMFGGTTITCNVPAGMMLFLEVVGAECSTVEEQPFHGENEAELRACAEGFGIADLQASIDGLEVKNLDQYIHTSPLFEFTLPDDNTLASDVLNGQSISHDANLIVAPFNPGKHVVHLHGSIPEWEFTVDTNIDLVVTP